jgi:hypothetical protein
MIEVNRKNFKSVLKDLVADFPELSTKVGKKGYGYSKISKIISEYNNNTSSNGEMFGMTSATAPF